MIKNRNLIRFGLTIPIMALAAFGLVKLYSRPLGSRTDGKEISTSRLPPPVSGKLVLTGSAGDAPPVSTEWHPPQPTRFTMCDAARDPDAYPNPGMRLIEADTGWIFRKEELAHAYGVPDVLIHETVRLLTQKLARTGTRLIVLISPPRLVVARNHLAALEGYGPDVTNEVEAEYRGVLQQLRQDGALVPDVLGEANRNGVAWDAMADPADLHWTPLGARMAAQAVTRLIANDARLKHATPIVYRLSRGPARLEVSGYYKLLNTLCGTNAPYADPIAFNPPERIAAGNALMASSKSLSIVIAGTSFTALDHRFNFSGFLGEATGLDVINMSMAGGGPIQALGQYLGSGALERDKPAFLVWEMTPWGLAPREDLLQIQGYIQPACQSEIRTKHRFDWADSRLFDERDIARLTSSAALLSIRSSNPALKKFIVRTRGYDGSDETYSVDFARAPSPPPTYQLELPDMQSVRSISIQADQMITGTIDATLCATTV